jgi:hypothetical protein
MDTIIVYHSDHESFAGIHFYYPEKTRRRKGGSTTRNFAIAFSFSGMETL